jgi:hypothetical protein
MEYNVKQSAFSKAMLTGLFIGIISTVVALFYNVIYRDSTGLRAADYINVSSIIFGVNLVFWIIGMIYYVFLRSFRRGDVIFEVVFLLLAVFCIWQTAIGHRSTDPEIAAQFRGLMIGVLVIMTIGVLLIPYCFHNRKFEDSVL